MVDLTLFKNRNLPGGYVITGVEFAEEPMLDALGREAIARTRIVGRKLSITIRADLSDKECSVTLYHEILEAMTVAVTCPPTSVMDFNEGDFERAGYAAFEHLGVASPENLNRMLQSYGFSER